ncbi:uncharacterized protein LOC141915242 [Tubulanus polymorphus]|uniref:uncharacterized protein LOC141915242 n=1 Tax=Tubulanus polymorphus TaxID=672921 RepID=UPI003DA39225
MDEYGKMIDSVKTLMQGKSTGASFWVNAYSNDKSGKQYQRWLNGTGPLVDRSLWQDPQSPPEGKCVYLHYRPSNAAVHGLLVDEECDLFHWNPLCETRPPTSNTENVYTGNGPATV